MKLIVKMSVLQKKNGWFLGGANDADICPFVKSQRLNEPYGLSETSREK